MTFFNHAQYKGIMFRNLRNYLKHKQWKKKGKPVPIHPYVKQHIVRQLVKQCSCSVFVETGTYLGDMVTTVKDLFNKIYSIELHRDLYEQAKKKFSNYPHIKIINGDSAIQIKPLLAEINEPCFFWLDGHYSGDGTANGLKRTPILEELQHIFDHHQKDHMIIIDDAKDFTGSGDYPTLAELKRFVLENRPDFSFSVADDIIRLQR